MVVNHMVESVFDMVVIKAVAIDAQCTILIVIGNV